MAIDPKLIKAQAYGRYNRVIAYNALVALGFLSRQLGVTGGTVYTTNAIATDGPYRPRQIEGIQYSNQDWHGVVQGAKRIIMFPGPFFRYTNGFPPQDPPLFFVFDTDNDPIYERGRLIATTPLPIAGAALKAIDNVVWIRAICWQPSTLDWVAFEKKQDDAVDTPTGWFEVGRKNWYDVTVEGDSTTGDGEPDQQIALRNYNQAEVHAYFDQNGDKAIGTFVGYASTDNRRFHTYLIDYDWPAGSGGPVTITGVEAEPNIETRVVVDPGPGTIVYNYTRSGSTVVGRDFDRITNEENQARITATGSLDVDIEQLGGANPALWLVDDQRLTDYTIPGNLTRAGVDAPGMTKSFTDTSGEDPPPRVYSAEGVANGLRRNCAGYDLRTNYISNFEEVVVDAVGPDKISSTVFVRSRDTNFKHRTFFSSSLGTVVHSDEDIQPPIGPIDWFDFLQTYAFPGGSGVRFEYQQPRFFIGSATFRNSPGPSPSPLFWGNANQYKFDRFGNELVYVEHSEFIFFLFTQHEPNPAFGGQANWLTGEPPTIQTLHDVSFDMDRIGIA